MVALDYGSVLLPSGWSVSTSISLIGPADTQAAGPTQGLHPVVQIATSSVPAGESGEVSAGPSESGAAAMAISEKQLQSLRTALPQFRLLDRGAFTRADGEEAPYLAFTCMAQPNIVLKQVQAVRVVGRDVMFITATAPFAHFERHWPHLKAVIESYIASGPASAA